MFHVLRRAGPDWDPSKPLEEQSDWPAHAAFMNGFVDAGFIVLGGPLSDEHRVVHAVGAESEEEIRATLAEDPWTGSHLRTASGRWWTRSLDGKTRLGAETSLCPSSRRRSWGGVVTDLARLRP
jgi:uncharacterized protein YciI